MPIRNRPSHERLGISWTGLVHMLQEDFGNPGSVFDEIYVEPHEPGLTPRQELALRFVERIAPTWVFELRTLIPHCFALADAILADGKEADVADINPVDPPDLQIINPGPKWEDVELLGGKLGEYPQRARTVDKDGKTYVEVQIDIPRRPTGHMFKQE